MRYANLLWNDPHTPEAADFGDIYFSRGQGVEESAYVFAAGNHLPERWRDDRPFTVTETGFGTGLNLRMLWRIWQRSSIRPRLLHFISYERFPLHPDDFRRAIAAQPLEDTLGDELCRAYPPAIPGWHERWLQSGTLRLSLFYGDVADGLPQQTRHADAWFLDGFAPARNPEMWTEPLFRQMARLSRPGSSFSTFTAAAMVREGLKAAGFLVEKRPGFGRKRDSLWGCYPGEATAPSLPPSPQPITVIGAGIAGATAAFHLAERGHSVTVLEAEAQPASHCSANPAALCAPVLEAGESTRQRFYAQALSYALNFWPRILPGWQACGWLKLAMDEEEALWQQKVLTRLSWSPDALQAVNAEEATRIAGLPLAKGGLYSPLAGWVPLPEACRRLLDHPNIQLNCSQPLERLTPHSEGWRIKTQDGSNFDSPLALLATAQAQRWLPELDIRPTAGQLTFAPPTAVSRHLGCILNYGGHATPVISGLGHVTGGTYRRGSDDATVTEADNCYNLTRWQAMLPETADASLSSPAGWAACRQAAPNHLPVIGRQSNGLYVSLAHGSRGSLSAPYAAMQLADALSYFK